MGAWHANMNSFCFSSPIWVEFNSRNIQKNQVEVGAVMFTDIALMPSKWQIRRLGLLFVRSSHFGVQGPNLHTRWGIPLKDGFWGRNKWYSFHCQEDHLFYLCSRISKGHLRRKVSNDPQIEVVEMSPGAKDYWLWRLRRTFGVIGQFASMFFFLFAHAGASLEKKGRNLAHEALSRGAAVCSGPAMVGCWPRQRKESSSWALQNHHRVMGRWRISDSKAVLAS